MENNPSLEHEISGFLNTYWKLIPEVEFCEISEEGEKKHFQYLRKKYGDKIIDKYFDYEKRYYNKINSISHTKEYLEFINFVYRTGLIDDINPLDIKCSRTILKLLLRNFMSKDEDFTIADLGSGDGKIAVGLSLYLERLKSIYTVDISPFALQRMQYNLKSLNKDERDRIMGKIIPICGDYLEDRVKKQLIEKEPKGIDIALLSIPFHGMDRVLEQVPSFIKNGGKMIGCWPGYVTGFSQFNSVNGFLRTVLLGTFQAICAVVLSN